MDDYDDISSSYEKRHLANIARTNERIREVFSQAINVLTLSAGRIRFNGEVFDLSKYPALKAQIEEVIAEMQPRIYSAIVNSIEASWGLSNEKNDVLVDRRLAGKKVPPNVSQVLYDPNRGALDAFVKRKDKGLDLSKRVWNALEPMKTELEKGLSLGISEGKPAKAMATELKQFLNEPDKLFRRVRDAKGKLKLSKAAKAYHPGQGVYRSSFKNAARLTRSEVNGAYAEADYHRWNALPFVIATEIKLSNAHVTFDICDHLKGRYPKDFKWSGKWHPQCLCSQVPVFASDEDYERIEDALLAGEEPPKIKGVEDVPQAFKDYVKDNRQRIESWSSKPYWAKDNPEYFAGKTPAKVVGMPKVEEAKGPKFTPAKTQKEAKQYVTDLFKDNFRFNVQNVTVNKSMSLDRLNLVNEQLTKLVNEYNIDKALSTGPPVSIIYNSGTRMEGVVHIQRAQGRHWIGSMNFGHESSRLTADFVKNKGTFNQAMFSRVDDRYQPIATATHEFAHVITNSHYQVYGGESAAFWKELKAVRKEYSEELLAARRSNDADKYQELLVSKYAHTNEDEFLAETFTEYKLAKQPSKYSEKVGKLIDKYYKK
jgi:hypothetical protein